MQAKLRIASLTAALALGVAVPTSADWNFGDPHKMHYPQLPELHEGIDVNASFPKILADDWLCTQSGPVSDIHIWGSWDYDYKYPGAWIHASIHEYLPPDPQIPYSRPGVVLWQHDFRPGEYTQRPWVDPEGPPPYPQFFWDPKQPFQPVVNHFEIWQYNIEDISNAFYQLAGTYYFLDISFFAGYDAAGNPIPLPPGFQFGWKTSRSPQFNDDAVWGHYGPGPYPPPPWWLPGYLKPDWPNPPDWNELRDPRFQFQRSLDLAFVITPEPTTLALIGLGLVVALRRR